MLTDFAIDLVDVVNSRLEPAAVLASIGFHAEKLQQTGERIKAFCPIHKDARFRSLLVDAERHAFRCTIKTCPGYTGGSLVELYALSCEQSLLQAACALGDLANPPLDEGWLESLAESYLDEANTARNRGDLTEAESILRELAVVAPQVFQARLILAELHDEMGNAQAAVDEFVAIIDDLLAGNFTEDAAGITDQILSRFPADEDVRFAAVRVAEAAGDPSLALQRMQDIIQMREADNRELDNIGLLEEMVQRAPGNADYAIKLGGLYERQHNVREASRQYEAAANAFLNAGDLNAAIAQLEKVVHFNSEYTRGRAHLADLLLRAGRTDEARTQIFRVANQQVDQQEFGLAVATINGWLEQEPRSVAARELLGRVFQEQERQPEAAAYLAEGAALASEDGNHEAATDLLLRAKYLTPDDAAIRQHLIQEFRLLEQHQKAAFEMIDLAEIYFSTEQTEPALQLLESAAETPISLSLKLQILTSLANHGATDLALEHLATLQSSHPDATPAELAEVLELQAQLTPTDATTRVQLVETLWQSDPAAGLAAAVEAASLLLQANDIDGAGKVIAAATQLIDTHLPRAQDLMVIAARIGRDDLAGSIYQATIQGLADADPEAALSLAKWMVSIDPNHPSASSDIGLLLAAIGRPEEAARQYAHVANLLYESGDYETGLQYAREAVALDQESVLALGALARLGQRGLPPAEQEQISAQFLARLQDTQDPATAADGYQIAAQLYPHDTDLLNRAAQVLLDLNETGAAAAILAQKAALLGSQGSWPEAVEVLQTAADLAPESPEIQEQFAEALALTDNMEQAACSYAIAAKYYAAANATADAERSLNSARLAEPAGSASWEAIFAAASAATQPTLATEAAERLSRLYAESGPATARARWAREWVRLQPNSARAQLALAQSLVAIEQPENAAPFFSSAAATFAADKDSANAVMALQPIVETGHISDADLDVLRSVFENADDKTPDLHSRAGSLLSQALASKKHFEEARSVAQQISPDQAAGVWLIIAENAAAGGQPTAEDWLASAAAFAETNRSDTAIATLQNAVAAGMTLPAIHQHLGELLARQGNLDLARPHLETGLGEAARHADPASLQSILDHLTATYKDDPSALTRFAAILLDAKQRALATGVLETAAQIALQENNTAALVGICGLDEAITAQSIPLTKARADALMGMKNAQEALEWVSTSTRKLLAENNFSDARQMAKRWIQLDATNPECHLLFATASLQSGDTPAAAAAMLKGAQLHANAGNTSEARTALDELLAAVPGDLQATALKAELEKKSGDNPAAAATYFALGQLQEAAGDTAAALDSYGQTTALAPTHTDALWRQAELTRASSGTQPSLPLYRKWATARRDVVSSDQWISDLEGLLAFAADSVALLRDLSAALLAQNRAANALPHLEQLAELYHAEGDYENAALALEQIIEHTPKPSAQLYIDAANAREKASQLTEAVAHLRHAVELSRQSATPKETAALLDRVIALAGEKAMPEDLSDCALAHARAGNEARAKDLVKRALETLNAQTANPDRRAALLEVAMQIEPLNPDYTLRHLDTMPPGRAMTEGLAAARQMQDAGRFEDAIQVISHVVALAPHDMSLRQHLFEPLRASGNTARLRQELLALASDALAAGDPEAAYEALDEAATIVETAQQHRSLAEINERAHRTSEAAAHFTAAAMGFAETGKTDQSLANINRALTARPGSFPAESMAELVEILGEPIYEIAREQLRVALSARKQKQSQVLALALMKNSTAARVGEILKTVYTLGGSAILAGIAHQRVDHLLEIPDLPAALELVSLLLAIAPDSSDSWHLSARVNNQAGNRDDAVRAAMEAARLYAIAGAVGEEEDAYKQALEAAPDDFSIKSSYAQFLAREHRPDEAVAQLQQVIESAALSGNMDVQLEALNHAVHIAPANVDLREKLARLLEQIAPDSAIDNWLQTAELYLESGENDRARRIYQHILQLNPRNEKALVSLVNGAREDADLVAAAHLSIRLADVKAARRNVGEACRILQAHLEIDPENLEVLERLAALAGASNDNEVFTTTTRALARKFQKMGDNAAALRHYEMLLERNPKDIPLLTTLIDCSAAAGVPEKGLIYARQMLNVARDMEDPERIRLAAATILNYDQGDADAHRELAESQLSLNRIPEAVTEFMRAAELYQGNGSNALALTCYRKVTQISPATTQAWRRLADIALTIGDIETARRSVIQVLESNSVGEAKRMDTLLSRLLQQLPEDEALRAAAYQFYRQSGNKTAAAAEAAWLAARATDENRIDEAEALYNKALALEPENPELKTAHYDFIRKIGRLEELQLRLRQEAEENASAGNTAAAIQNLRELTTLAPGQIAIHRDLAQQLETAKRDEEALEEYLTVIRLLLERSELEEARESAERLVSKYGQAYACREKVGDLLAETAYPDLAARYYRTAADSAIADKQPDQAIHLLNKAIAARPLWIDARKALAEIYETTSSHDAALNTWLELIPVLIEAGEFLEATSTLHRLAKSNPESTLVREQLAQLYEKTGRKQEYLSILRELADIYEQQSDKQNIINTYQRLTQADPEDGPALARYLQLASEAAESDDFTHDYGRLADALARSGDIEGAFQAYERVLAHHPEDTSVRSRYARFLLTRGSRNRALTEMRGLGNIYMQRGEPAAAVEVLNAALTISPRDADLCLELAKAQESAGLLEDARVSYARASAILASTAAVKGIDTYRRILSVDENNTAVRLRLVELLIKSGDKMEAAREARILAEIHIDRGEIAQAEHAFQLVDQCEPETQQQIEEAIQRDSYDPSLQYLHYVRLGNLHFNCGDIDSALDAYRTARSLHDDQVDLIQKCIDCLSLIAPDAEAIPDYLVMAEKLILSGHTAQARKAYEKVRMIDPFNNDARCGIESVDATERHSTSASNAKPLNDDQVLKASRTINKRVALMDLLRVCQDAASSQPPEDTKLGTKS